MDGPRSTRAATHGQFAQLRAGLGQIGQIGQIDRSRQSRHRTLTPRTTVVTVTAATVMAIFATRAEAATKHAAPSDGINNVETTFKGLNAGDELILADGTYEMSGLFDFNITGTQNNPILIRAADGAHPHFHRAGVDQNLWDFRAEYTTIRGLRFSGGSAGLRVQGANHLTIEDCEIDHTRDVAIRMNDGGVTYESVHILRNEIHHTGVNGGGTSEGMYLGCNENGCRLANGLIQGNHVYSIDNPDISQGDGIELKEGSYGTTISDNVIHNTNYPCILTYSAVGNGAPNIIERNLLFGCGDHAIQSAADAIIRNNIILSGRADGIAMQPHQNGSPANLTVENNTILGVDGYGISVRSPSGSVVIANNAIYADGTAIYLGSNTGSVTVRGNVGTGSAPNGAMSAGNLANDVVNGHTGGSPPIDLFPTAGGALRGAGDARDVPSDDFNGTARNGTADVGAYAYQAGGNPGWPLAAAMKDSQPSSGTDAGVPDARTPDAGTTDAQSTDARAPDASARTDAGTMPDSGRRADASTSRADASGVSTDAADLADAGVVAGDDSGVVASGPAEACEGGCNCHQVGCSSVRGLGQTSALGGLGGLSALGALAVLAILIPRTRAQRRRHRQPHPQRSEGC
ncbi:MAG: right-handed parallel beta-helix repeat-containing protein [Deltaproteobacteria bacterium]|nr:right-handed parallel beta-helix repeat-containing protein [Deltaproteobacteria bacterium]